VQSPMAVMTKRDEVLLGVPSAVTAKYLMVHFQSAHASAELTTPGIPFQDSKPQRLGQLWINLRVAWHSAPRSQSGSVFAGHRPKGDTSEVLPRTALRDLHQKHARQPESPRRSFRDSNRVTYPSQASTSPSKSLLHDRDLTLVELEINNVRRLGVLSSEVLLNFVPKLFSWHCLRIVRPLLTIESVTI